MKTMGMKKIGWTLGVMLGLAVCGVGCNHQHGEKEEGNEVKMSIDQVPAPVRATLMREAPGATITTVDKEEDKGKVIYEADAMIGGKNWEIKVDADGKVISKRLDNEAEEKEGAKK
jgi:uncharacterized membrane protein YkoI